MKASLQVIRIIKKQDGATAIVLGIVLFMLLACGAVAIDIGHLCLARVELQNAADAGALAGAHFLYNNNGTLVNEGANQIGHDAAEENRSEREFVEVNWSIGTNEGDVQRGHWRFADSSFTANASLDPVDLWNVSSEDLDNNMDFINALKVTARREATPIASFFARIFGYDGFQISCDAVGYIGFAGTLTPFDVDQPIAICQESLLETGEYSCAIGRMINSGQNVESSETGGWTSFNQEGDPCAGGTNANEVNRLVCGEGNPGTITLGGDMATSGGEIESAMASLRRCWETETGKTELWNLTLPVISCPSNNVGTCEGVQGAVNVNIVWITGPGEDPDYINAPTDMGGWSYPYTIENGPERWASFVEFFALQNVDGSPAPYAKKSIYFKPDCEPHIPAGTSGGANFGILAEIPVLVE
jgi:hypothetical protein